MEGHQTEAIEARQLAHLNVLDAAYEDGYAALRLRTGTGSTLLSDSHGAYTAFRRLLLRRKLLRVALTMRATALRRRTARSMYCCGNCSKQKPP